MDVGRFCPILYYMGLSAYVFLMVFFEFIVQSMFLFIYQVCSANFLGVNWVTGRYFFFFFFFLVSNVFFLIFYQGFVRRNFWVGFY